MWFCLNYRPLLMSWNRMVAVWKFGGTVARENRFGPRRLRSA
jgi:hypothetical protein